MRFTNEDRIDCGSLIKYRTSTWSWASDQRKLDISAADLYRLLQGRQLDAIDGAMPRLRRLRFEAGQRVFDIGQNFQAVAVVWLGFFKTFTVDADGAEQVVGFPMRGNVIGVDAIELRSHQSCAQALSSGELILIPYEDLLTVGRLQPDLRSSLLRAVSAELEGNLAMIRLLAVRNAEARIARFLVLLGTRHGALGYSDTEFILRMRRCDIGNFLGITLETVCRTLTTLRSMGIIELKRQHLRILDRRTLATLERLPPSASRLKQIEANRLRRRNLRLLREPTLH